MRHDIIYFRVLYYFCASESFADVRENSDSLQDELVEVVNFENELFFWVGRDRLQLLPVVAAVALASSATLTYSNSVHASALE